MYKIQYEINGEELEINIGFKTIDEALSRFWDLPEISRAVTKGDQVRFKKIKKE